MVHLVIPHGRSHQFEIPALAQRPLEEAARFCLPALRRLRASDRITPLE